MIKRLYTRLIVLILVIIVITGVSLGISSALTKTNQLEVLVTGLRNLIEPKKEEPPKEIKPIEVEYIDSNLITLQNSATFTLKVKTELKQSSNPKYQFFLSQKPNNSNSFYWYAVLINNIGIGDFNQTIALEDVTGAAGEIKITGQRQSFSLPFGLNQISDWEDINYTVNGDYLLALVDKQNKLPLDYAPKNLVDINKDLLLYTNSSEPIQITAEAGDALRVMAKDLQLQTGKNLVIASGYRSYNDQYRTYAGWVRQLGQEEADKVSARPGFSEHQLGTVVDFVDQETGFDLTNEFEKGIAGKWLIDNAYKYGFVQSYPANRETETGYRHEAWHWRFVGIDNAKAYKDSGLALNIWIAQNISQ